MMKLKLSLITMMLLFVISTISSRSKKHEDVGNENAQSDTAILGSNPNQNQNKKELSDQGEPKNIYNPILKYTGVCWKKDNKKWQAQLKVNEKLYFGGLFDNQQDAAMSVNKLCDQYAIARKNPTIDIKSFKAHQVQKSTSQYIGVCWNRKSKKWHSHVRFNEKVYYGGLFDNEEDAAMKTNLLCDKFGIRRKNPAVDKELFIVPNQTSQYFGVSLHKATKKWETKLTHDKKQYFGGLFDREEDAAMKVNLLCDKLGIKRKNPMVIIKPNAIQQHGDKHLINTLQKRNPKKKNNTTRLLTQKNYKKLLLSSEDESSDVESSENFSDEEDSVYDYKVTVNSQLDDTKNFYSNDSTRNEKRKRNEENKFTLESVVNKAQGLNISKKEHKIEEENEFSYVYFHEDMLKKFTV